MPGDCPEYWSRFERVWLAAFLGVIILATVSLSLTGTDYGDAEGVLLNWVISPLSAITGTLWVVIAAKGRLSNWAYGIVNSALYGYLGVNAWHCARKDGLRTWWEHLGADTIDALLATCRFLRGYRGNRRGFWVPRCGLSCGRQDFRPTCRGGDRICRGS